jgi:alpha,alpha-trehalose phosphorylase
MSWKITSTSLQPEQLAVEESLYALANGYLGVRGNFEEGYQKNLPTIRGTYINAYHDIVDISYGEKFVGYPETQQKIVNIMDSQTIELFITSGGVEEKFSLFEGEVLSYDRHLHLDKGYTERNIHWRSPNGKELRLTFERIVSFERKELFAIRVTITPVNFTGKVKIRSAVNGDVLNYVNENDPRVGNHREPLLFTVSTKSEDGLTYVLNRTKRSNLETACVTDYIFSTGERHDVVQEKQVLTEVTMDLTTTVTFEKRNVYVDTLRHGDHIVAVGKEIQQTIHELTFKQLLTEQQAYLNQFWKTADIKIYGDEEIQVGIRFNLYQLLQSAGRDPYSFIAAKGLSGEGYEGHYFWDTEIYMLPLFIMTKPEIARGLLLYRYSKLEQAKVRAKEMGHRKGALYPWRTISGTECSPYYPGGSAQYHISADIAYSFIQYYLATGDEEFLHEYAAEVLFETARLWIETGHFRDGKFRIDCVTGPDEYTALVNNNYYTNVMAKYNLMWAAKVYKDLANKNKAQFDQLVGRLQLLEREVMEWGHAAENMYLPYDERLDINPQDDTFLQKAIWDFEGTPKEHYPLLLHYHPLTLYRYQVCKQADTVLAHFLLEDEQSFSTIKNSYNYYEKITTHDSSLSSCIFSIMAAKIGDSEKAYQYFRETVRMDLDNIQGNTKDGLHLANMGGAWLAIVFGFAGLRIKESGLYLSPILPKAWSGYECTLQYKGRLLHINITKQSLSIQNIGPTVDLFIYNKPYTISNNQTIEIEK